MASGVWAVLVIDRKAINGSEMLESGFMSRGACRVWIGDQVVHGVQDLYFYQFVRTHFQGRERSTLTDRGACVVAPRGSGIFK